MGEPYASLLSGMVLGVDVPKTLTIYNYFKLTGLLHLVVLSGSNINFLVTTVMRISALVGKKIGAIISICVITIFILLMLKTVLANQLIWGINDFYM
jgi:predicted membrane metal-binding protein